MRILVTSIGSFSADCVISSLKNEHFIVGCDIYPAEWHVVSKDCNKTYQVPYSAHPDYISQIIKICIDEKIDILLPLTDPEVDVLNSHRDDFSSQGTLICIPPSGCIEIARNKYAICSMFETDELVHVPHFCKSNEIPISFPFPAIAKPINGRSSEGLFFISSLEDSYLVQRKSNYIIEEYLEGNVITVDYLRDSQGNDCSISREELIRTKNGAGLTVRLFNDDELKKAVSHIGKRLNVKGCINMEFIFCKGAYYLIDINPRFSAGIAFSKLAGYDIVNNCLNCFMNLKIMPNVPVKEQIAYKRYIEQSL